MKKVQFVLVTGVASISFYSVFCTETSANFITIRFML